MGGRCIPRALLALTETLTFERTDPFRQAMHNLGKSSQVVIVKGLYVSKLVGNKPQPHEVEDCTGH